MADATFGEGLGQVIGGALGAHDLGQSIEGVNMDASNFAGVTMPYNNFGQSFIPKATDAIDNISAVAGKDPLLNYNNFMKDYQASPGAKYTIDQATNAIDNSAAARGKLLSGGTERELATTTSNIADTFANQAYTNYLQGSNTQFSQLESALGNMFNAIGVGTTATGQQASVNNAQMGATAQLASAQAKNDQSKGSGFGSMFSGLGSIAAMF